MNKTTQENALETGDIISLKREQTELRFSFPKFGKSPGPTPEPSQPPTPDLLDLEDMSVSCERYNLYVWNRVKKKFPLSNSVIYRHR